MDTDQTVRPRPMRDILSDIAQGFGGTAPNAFRVLARNETVLRAFHAMMGEMSNGLLSDIDREVIAIAVAMENQCQYCTTAHEKVAKKCGAPEADIDAIVGGDRPRDARARLLISTVKKLYERNGRLGQMDLGDLTMAGISEAELLEIITYMSAYQTLSFVTNNWDTPIDPQFRG